MKKILLLAIVTVMVFTGLGFLGNLENHYLMSGTVVASYENETGIYKIEVEDETGERYSYYADENEKVGKNLVLKFDTNNTDDRTDDELVNCWEK